MTVANTRVNGTYSAISDKYDFRNLCLLPENIQEVFYSLAPCMENKKGDGCIMYKCSVIDMYLPQE